MDNHQPEVMSIWAYWNALDDLSESFEVLAKRCKLIHTSKDSQSMWWEMYLGMHKCISELKRKADDAFHEAENDMYQQLFHTEQPISPDEIPF